MRLDSFREPIAITSSPRVSEAKERTCETLPANPLSAHRLRDPSSLPATGPQMTPPASPSARHAHQQPLHDQSLLIESTIKGPDLLAVCCSSRRAKKNRRGGTHTFLQMFSWQKHVVKSLLRKCYDWRELRIVRPASESPAPEFTPSLLLPISQSNSPPHGICSDQCLIIKVVREEGKGFTLQSWLEKTACLERESASAQQANPLTDRMMHPLSAPTHTPSHLSNWHFIVLLVVQDSVTKADRTSGPRLQDRLWLRSGCKMVRHLFLLMLAFLMADTLSRLEGEFLTISHFAPLGATHRPCVGQCLSQDDFFVACHSQTTDA